MSLTIDGAKLIEERNSYSDKQADKVVEWSLYLSEYWK